MHVYSGQVKNDDVRFHSCWPVQSGTFFKETIEVMSCNTEFSHHFIFLGIQFRFCGILFQVVKVTHVEQPHS